jgi:Protein of unknown function (DUF4242)
MALYLVERDVGAVSPDQLRLDQRAVASACSQVNSLGKRVRYINSAVVPTDGRALDLFGAQSAETIKEVHAVAHVGYARIVEILDLTPGFLQPATSRSRHSPKKGVDDTMADSAAPGLARWLADGQRFFGLCLELLEKSNRLQARAHTLETENEMLREEVTRLRHKIDLLQTERADMVAAFNDLAGHVTQVVDHILQKSEDGENSNSK